MDKTLAIDITLDSHVQSTAEALSKMKLSDTSGLVPVHEPRGAPPEVADQFWYLDERESVAPIQ